MIDVVQLFKDKATLKEWLPLYGAKEFQSFEQSQYDLAPDQEILFIFPFRDSAVIDNGVMNGRRRFDGKLMLCRKSEADTVSSVAETNEQKYENRIKDLTYNFWIFISEVMNCTQSPNIEPISVSGFQELNYLSANVDGVSYDISFYAWE